MLHRFSFGGVLIGISLLLYAVLLLVGMFTVQEPPQLNTSHIDAVSPAHTVSLMNTQRDDHNMRLNVPANLSRNGSGIAAVTATLRQADKDSCKYIGDRESHVYHLASADHLPKPEDRVCFSSRKDAEKAGYRPCKECFPCGCH